MITSEPFLKCDSMFLEKSFRGNNRWFLYIATIVLVFLATQLASVPIALYSMWGNWESLLSGGPIVIKGNTNFGLALLLFTYTAGFWALVFCIKGLHGKTVTDVSTGRNKFDWKRCLYGGIIWVILSLITLAIQFLSGDASSLVFQFEPLKFFVMLLIILIFIPFQVGWEELLFRGYLMQGFARLFKYRWVPLLLTGIIFGLLHVANPEVEEFGFWVSMPQYIIMGLLLSYVAIKDDGMELALGLHLANNILSSVLVTHHASALQTHALFIETAPTSSHMDSIVMFITAVLFVLICNHRYHFLSKNNLMEKIKRPEAEIF